VSLSVNRVMLGGNLTREPELKKVGDAGREVANFGLAINRKYKTADGELRDDPTFVDCEAWGGTAQLIGEHLRKGAPCLIEGRLRLDRWKNQQGENRSRLLVVVDRVHFLPRGQRREERPEPVAARAGESGFGYEPEGDDDAPLF